MKNNHIEIAGIEFLEAINGDLYTYDINTNTNYNSIAENLSDLSGMKAIADFLKRELEKLDWQIISQHSSRLMVGYFMSNKFR